MKMGKNVSRCSRCGGTSLERATRTQLYQFGDAAFRIEIPCDRCENCGETFTHLQDIRKSNLVVARHLAVSGPVTGRAFKHMRESIQLSAADLAEQLGVAASTLSRWENEKQTIDRATWLTLGTMVLDKEKTLERIEALEKPPRGGRIIRLEFEA